MAVSTGRDADAGKSDAVLIGFDAPEAPDPAELARHAMDFWLTTEDLPLPDNRVTVDSEGQITLCYQPTNLEAHKRLREKFTGMLDAIQCRSEVLENYSYRGGRLGISGVAHQNGTVPLRHRSGVLRPGSGLPDARAGQPLRR